MFTCFSSNDSCKIQNYYNNKIVLMYTRSLLSKKTACVLMCFPFNMRSYFVWRNKVLKCPISFSPLIQFNLARIDNIGAFPGLKFTVVYRHRFFVVVGYNNKHVEVSILKGNFKHVITHLGHACKSNYVHLIRLSFLLTH